ncbi:hypothetical protein MOQ14_14415 [Stenotrophomonas maltophilia]|uniref:hypothetical protein n=1 Tax=Stenotrophomonas maltophilia TaxID=40324 RepID=UPI001F53BF85|nr:hypothetical protein [Stenotrophomonas maltophilia]MCI1139767.1 hypothetical protein [Stenotrophomonas maltophilia]
MYRLTKTNGLVQCVETTAFFDSTADTWQAMQYREWLSEGNQPEPYENRPPYTLYSPEHFRAIRDAAFDWMTTEVRSRGYDDIPNCASYFNSSVTRYRQEARALVAWRDAVNQKLEQLVLAPPAGIETWEHVRALLPQPEAFDWPERAELPLDIDDKAVLT